MNFKPNNLTLLSAILFFILAPQLNAAPDKDPNIVKGGPIVEGYQLIVQTDADVFLPSNPIVISIALKNTTKKVLEPFVRHPEADYKFEIKNAKGQPVLLTPYGKERKKLSKTFFGIGPIELFTGEDLKDTFQINLFYEMTKNDVYLIKVKRSVPKADKTGLTPIESNVVRVKVDSSFKPAPPAPVQPSEQPKVE